MTTKARQIIKPKNNSKIIDLASDAKNKTRENKNELSNTIQSNPASSLSRETRDAIKAIGVSLDNYASNIEDKLRSRGESQLAERMIEEINESMASPQR